MDEKGFAGRWMGRFRTLTLVLIFSGTLNIALFATLAFLLYEERRVSFEVSPLVASQATVKMSNSTYLSTLSQLHFRELVAQLTNRDVVEEGYLKRDLALAILVSDHSFHLEKALEGTPIQRRLFQMGAHKMIELYPGLSEEQFQAIVRYAYQEKWPFTSKGLFSLLKKGVQVKDATLQQAFVLSPEFHAVRVLFQKSGAVVEESLLVTLVLEGNWEFLEQFGKEASLQLDFSVERRRDLLLKYLSYASPTAALLLLRTDPVFVCKGFEDRAILELLSLLPEKSEEGKCFAMELLKSPRSDQVHENSASFLFRSIGVEQPVASLVEEARVRFLPTAIAKTSSPKMAEVPSKKTIHIVKEGESLWKISRQYKVKLEDLIALNGLEKERLLPGMELVIP